MVQGGALPEEREPVYRCRLTHAVVDACEAAEGINVITLSGEVKTAAGDMLTYHPEEHGYRVWSSAAFARHYEEAVDPSEEE